ncbi:MAG: type II toxin-antitoxin system RelE/ParE family toxin [Phycisphaerae bacterium]|jgi:phage-related protein|nr:type II toxin-antitoxin system RelE/ParE family toxin [Phycisphaerae bacterium]
MREIIFYRTLAGKSPIGDFLDSLSSKQARKVAWVLSLVEELEIVPKQYFKKMVNTEDLWEVRVRMGSNIFRLLGFFDGAKIVVLSHAFQKKTQKTPQQAIKLAEERKVDYFKRKKK